MKGKTTKKMIALWFSILIIGIPFYTSFVFADSTFEIVEAKGLKTNYATNKTAYIKQGIDQLQITVKAMIDGHSVSPEDVVFSNDQTETFQTCDTLESGNFCTWTSPEQTFYSTRLSLKIFLKKQGVTEAEDTATLIVDGDSPEIKDFKIVNNQIKMSLRDPEDSTCSGIKSAELFVNNEKIYSVQLNDEPGKCSLRNYTEDLSSSEKIEGKETVCLTVKDFVGNEISSCKEQEIDTKPPSAADYGIMGPNKDLIKYYGPRIDRVYFFIDIFETSGIKSGSAIADLSDINPKFGDSYKSMELICTKLNLEKFRCITKNSIKPDLTSKNYFNFDFSVKDSFNNSFNTSKSVELMQDSVSPVIEEFYVGKQYEGNSYVAETGSGAFIKISEADSGVNKAGTLLQIRGQNIPFIPNSCKEDLCEWVNLKFSGTHLQQVDLLISQFQDNAGNIGEGKTQTSAILDKEVPELVKVELVGSYEEFETESLLKSGDFLDIKMEFKDEIPVSAKADFSEIVVDGKTDEEGECYKDNQTWFCQWSSGPVVQGPRNNVPIKITYEDLVGNKETYVRYEKVYGLSEEESNYASINRHVSSINPLDRELASFVHKNIPVYFPFEIFFRGEKAEDIELVDANLIGCVGKGDVEDGVISSSDVPRALLAGTQKPMIRMYIDAPVTLPNRDLEYECQYKITVRDRDYVYLPEVENITLKINLYDNPLGEYSDSLQDKVSSIKEGWIFKAKLIDDLSLVLKYSKMICSVLKLMSTFSSTMSLTAETLDKVNAPEYIQKPFEILDLTSATTNNAYFKALDKFCQFARCSWGPVQWFGMENYEKFLDKWFLGNIFQKNLQQNIEGFLKTDLESRFDPTQSLVTSIFTLCLPGIITNIAKARNIECYYVYCMTDMIEIGKSTPFICDQIRASSWCNFCYTEMWNLVPMSQVLSGLMGELKYGVNNPFILMGLPLALTCKFYPKSFLCTLPGNLKQWKETIIKPDGVLDTLWNAYLKGEKSFSEYKEIEAQYYDLEEENLCQVLED